MISIFFSSWLEPVSIQESQIGIVLPLSKFKFNSNGYIDISHKKKDSPIHTHTNEKVRKLIEKRFDLYCILAKININ